MPIVNEIREDGHAIYQRYTDPWTLAELVELVARNGQYRDQVPFPIHSVVNIEALRLGPGMDFPIRNLPAFTHPRRGHIAVVGAAPIGRIYLEFIRDMEEHPAMKFFEKEAEAWDYIRAAIRAEQQALDTDESI